MPQPTTGNAQPAQQKQVVASPNPTIDDSKTKPGDATKVEGTPVQPAATTTDAPLKTKSKKSKHRRTKPSGD